MSDKVNRFDEKTSQAIGYYVYGLRDGDNPYFYIGKGVNNRVFAHLDGSIVETENENLKYDAIRESKDLNHIILRHGLTEDEALTVECTLIDTFKSLGWSLTNIQGGHNSIEKGLASTDELIRRYNAETLRSLPDNSLIININKSYVRGNDVDSIYKATKETWPISAKRLPDIKYVLSEYQGLIVEVFEVDEWYQKERRYKKGSKKEGQKYLGYGFNGRVASNEIRESCLNKSIKEYKKRGQAWPIRYKLDK